MNGSCQPPQERKRLEATIPNIEEVKDICEAPSVSFGVSYGGEPIFTKSIGLCDVENGQLANEHTSYHIGSCAKIFTSAAIGILVDEGKISWQDPVRKHLDDFDPVEDREIGKKATIRDVCRHSTGLANPNAVLMAPHGAPGIKSEEYMKMINALPTANEHGQRFNSWWYYSNAAYGLLGLVVKAVAGVDFATFLRTRICNPLGLKETLLTEHDVTNNSNLAHPYVKRDGEWHKIYNGLTSEGNSHTLPSLGIRSSVSDMLLFGGAVMDRYAKEQQSQSEENETPQLRVPWSDRLWGLRQTLGLIAGSRENPLRQISYIWKSYWTRPCDDDFDNKTAYMLGWLRTTMPTAALPLLSYNSYPTKNEYIIGRKSPPQVLYGHSGCTNGSVATIYVIPQSGFTVVALSNAADAGDASNSTVQILLQAIYDLGPKVDLILSLKESREMKLKQHEDMINDWEKHRDVGKYNCNAEELVGTYHGLGASIIDIKQSNNLAVVFGRQDRSRCELDRFNQYSLSFLPMDHKEILERAMIDWDYWTVGVFRFVREDETQPNSPVVGLRWKWDQYEDSILWVKQNDKDKMNDNYYKAVVKKHGKFLKDPWAKSVATADGNGPCNGSRPF
uniref:Beta-lactamase-related domain-containing protein n=1 Tax=Bionectria ochroleuca TaxID=29856 RepID=A0A0B7KP92_BIOOC